ncbi:hypothetical protein NC653_035394 [Populus alba x Populus x berolinensis]|uniref:Uncharacterized protein n=2 Tax=Populus alba x Populus x berolinensis TaxID=444605 RepID=A0AAD6LQ05_9ROSI|nr:hypothetical protein NC653_035394 [Populus alba x Populus x berolinensis]
MSNVDFILCPPYLSRCICACPFLFLICHQGNKVCSGDCCSWYSWTIMYPHSSILVNRRSCIWCPSRRSQGHRQCVTESLAPRPPEYQLVSDFQSIHCKFSLCHFFNKVA